MALNLERHDRYQFPTSIKLTLDIRIRVFTWGEKTAKLCSDIPYLDLEHVKAEETTENYIDV